MNPRRAQRQARVPGPVRGLAGVSFLNDVASEMVYPLLPALITGPLGAGALALGILDGASDVAASLLRWWSGRLADRPGWRSRLMSGGYALAAAARPAMALAASAGQVIGLRVLDRVGKGLRSPARDALIADLTAPSLHGRAFGLQRAFDHLGAVVGSLIAFALVARHVPVTTVIAASVIPGGVAVLWLAFVLARAARGDRLPAQAFTSGPVPPPAVVPARPALVMLACLTAARLPDALALLVLQDRGVAVALLPLLWAALHVVRSSASFGAGRLTDRLGAAPILVGGSVGYLALLAAYAAAGSLAVLVTAFLGLGVATGLAEPAERVLVVEAGGHGRGRAFGFYQAIGGTGALGVGALLGWLYQSRGATVALGVAAALSGVALVMLLTAPGARNGPWSLAWPKAGR